jgi:hypothetical protein
MVGHRQFAVEFRVALRAEVGSEKRRDSRSKQNLRNDIGLINKNDRALFQHNVRFFGKREEKLRPLSHAERIDGAEAREVDHTSLSIRQSDRSRFEVFMNLAVKPDVERFRRSVFNLNFEIVELLDERLIHVSLGGFSIGLHCYQCKRFSTVHACNFSRQNGQTPSNQEQSD